MKKFLKFIEITNIPIFIGVIVGGLVGSLVLLAYGEDRLSNNVLWGHIIISGLLTAITLSIINWWRSKKGYGIWKMDDL
jgi:hypothetical protein